MCCQVLLTRSSVIPVYNTVLVNSYVLSSYVGSRTKGSSLDKGQLEFREKLISQIFEHTKAQGQMPKLPSLAPDPRHVRVRRPREQGCLWMPLLQVRLGNLKKNGRHWVNYRQIRVPQIGLELVFMAVRHATCLYVRKGPVGTLFTV